MRAFFIDPNYVAINCDSSKLNHNDDVLYSRDPDPSLLPGEVVLGKVSPMQDDVVFVPSPCGMKIEDNCGGEEIESIRKRALKRKDYKVLGIASTDSVSWTIGKQLSVIVDSQHTKFLHTGCEKIWDGDTVMIRLPTSEEVLEHINRYNGKLKFVTYGRNLADETQIVDEFLEYLATNEFQSSSVSSDDMSSARGATTRLISSVLEAQRGHFLPTTAEETDMFRENYFVHGNIVSFFTDEIMRREAKLFLHKIFQVVDCLREKNDNFVVGRALGDIQPYSEGRLIMTR